MDLLAALADPSHEEHAALTEWIGRSWDAEYLPSVAINRRLARLKPKAVGGRE